MAGIFNRAYNQANRILNGSGLSSIVYRDKGGKTDKRWNFATPGKLEWQATLDRHADRLLEDEERRYSGQESRVLNPDFYTKDVEEFVHPVSSLIGNPFSNREQKTREQLYREIKEMLGNTSEEVQRQWNLAGKGFKRVQDSQGRIRVARPNNVAPVIPVSDPRHI